MDYQLQVITLSVSDVDKATAFYTQQAGFALNVDYYPASDFRVVQLTPPGSACSVQIGAGLTDAPPGSARSLTGTEQTVASLAADGLNNGQVAARMYISTHTVAHHLRQAFRKLSIASRYELTRIVMEQAADGARVSNERWNCRR